MTRCCDWRPDPTVFGPCPHCRPPGLGRVATEKLNRQWLLIHSDGRTLADLTQGANP